MCLGIIFLFAAFEIQIFQYCVKMQKLKCEKTFHNLFILIMYTELTIHINMLNTHTHMLIQSST